VFLDLLELKRALKLLERQRLRMLGRQEQPMWLAVLPQPMWLAVLPQPMWLAVLPQPMLELERRLLTQVLVLLALRRGLRWQCHPLPLGQHWEIYRM
jgi:hypothetical protein